MHRVDGGMGKRGEGGGAREEEARVDPKGEGRDLWRGKGEEQVRWLKRERRGHANCVLYPRGDDQEKKLTASGGDGLGRIGEKARKMVTSVEERIRGKKKKPRGDREGFTKGLQNRLETI
jgi:hypothetical protein